MSTALLWLAVALLCGVASVARSLVDAAVSSRARGRFPIGTFTVNLSGALLLGLLIGLSVHGDAYLLAGTAVLGSYTTFSAWMLESSLLAERAEWGLFALNILASLVLGVAAVAAGRLIGGG
ncbi:MAG TPA: fluoride efflux transporter CrcB [Solirubrobacteraceae bacterium]|jgi:CrcB protein|nr:fluoride efflux transporter CrcB [Solirubrobacteraceae bacterium]